LIGELENYPVGIPRLLPGDKVRFKRQHIIDIWTQYDEAIGAAAS
jgi:hypothetical protein